MDSRAKKPHVRIPKPDRRIETKSQRYILQPADSGYNSVIQIDNGRVNQQPQLIVMANAVEDVVAALRFAQKQQVNFTVIGGGHSAAGYCLNTGGMVLDPL